MPLEQTTTTGTATETGIDIVIGPGSEVELEALTIESEMLALARPDVRTAESESETGVIGVAPGQGGIGPGLDGGMTAANEAALDQEPTGQNAVAQDVVSAAALAPGWKGETGPAHGLEAAYEIVAGTAGTAPARDCAPTGETEAVHEQDGNAVDPGKLSDPCRIATSHETDLPENEVGIVPGTGTGIVTGTGVATETGTEIVTVIATATEGAVHAHGQSHPPCDQQRLGKRTMRSGSVRKEYDERRKPRHTLPRKKMLAKKVSRCLGLMTGQRLAR